MPRCLPYLESTRTLIRFAQPTNISAIITYYRTNQVHLKPFEPLREATFYTQDYWLTEIQNRFHEFHADKSVKLFLFEKTNPSAVIGSVNFSNVIRGAFQSCTTGYSLAADKQGQGYMTEALQVAIHYLFDQLNFHRIMAAYMPHNRRSSQLLKRLGFIVEGYARDYLRINDQWEDHILTSLINPNWRWN
ncbi:MAG: GNAT family N-acetyltransferase [Pseudanabaenales cyanobacterium]|nr:GNAT family N-acetyltransferase [Pseudanabaenales cyanobacterium]